MKPKLFWTFEQKKIYERNLFLKFQKSLQFCCLKTHQIKRQKIANVEEIEIFFSIFNVTALFFVNAQAKEWSTMELLTNALRLEQYAVATGKHKNQKKFKMKEKYE